MKLAAARNELGIREEAASPQNSACAVNDTLDSFE